MLVFLYMSFAACQLDTVRNILARFIGAPFTANNYLGLLPLDVQTIIALFLAIEKDRYNNPPLVVTSIAEIKKITTKLPAFDRTHRHKYFLYITQQEIPGLNCKIAINTEIYLPQGEHPTEYYSDVEEDPEPYDKTWDDMDDFSGADTFLQFYPA